MVRGGLGWDYKTPLVFLTRVEGKRGICSTAYLNQVLKDIVFPYYDSLKGSRKRDFIFMEDGAKVHKGKARLPKLEKGIRGFD